MSIIPIGNLGVVNLLPVEIVGEIKCSQCDWTIYLPVNSSEDVENCRRWLTDIHYKDDHKRHGLTSTFPSL